MIDNDNIDNVTDDDLLDDIDNINADYDTDDNLDNYDDLNDDTNADENEDKSEEQSDEFDNIFGNKDSKGKPNKLYEKMREKAEEQARRKIESELQEEKNRIQQSKLQLEQQLSERKILDEYINPRKIYEYAENEGISEELAEKMLRFEAEKLIESEKSKVQQKFEHLQQQKKSLQNDKYFHLLAQDVERVLEQRPDLDFQTVYYHMKGMREDELNKQLISNTEKRTIANLQDKSRRKSVANSDSNINPVMRLSETGKKIALAMGVDPREVQRHVAKRIKDFK